MLQLTKRELRYRKTIAWRAMAFLLFVSRPVTATAIARILGEKLATVSGVLKREVDAGRIKRTSGWGPRKGYGYSL